MYECTAAFRILILNINIDGQTDNNEIEEKFKAVS